MTTHRCGATIVPGQIICSGCPDNLLDESASLWGPPATQPLPHREGVIDPGANATQPVPTSDCPPTPLSGPMPVAPNRVEPGSPRRRHPPSQWCAGTSNPQGATCAICGDALVVDGPLPSPSGQVLLPHGAQLFVHLGQPLELGRSTGNPYVDRELDRYGTVSKRHLRISLTASSVTVTDLGSKNGTTVDGIPAQPVIERPLRRLVIGLGRSVIVHFIPPTEGMP